MAKKDGFDFDTGSKGKFSLDFLKNLTKKQKEIIFIAVVAIVIVALVATVVVLIASVNSGNGSGLVGIFGGGSSEDGGESGEGGGGNDETSLPTIPDAITRFYISSVPNKTTYYLNQAPDYSGLVFHLISEEFDTVISYDDNPDAFTITGFDSSAPIESQTITVECKGYTDTFNITIKERENPAATLVSIHFATYPKQEYHVDDQFDHTAGVLVCTYSDGSSKEIPLQYNYISGISKTKDPTKEHIFLPGEYTLVVKYIEDSVLAETEYTITVTE